jgi:hypothetical protein
VLPTLPPHVVFHSAQTDLIVHGKFEHVEHLFNSHKIWLFSNKPGGCRSSQRR